MPNDKLLSIVIPVRNAESTLQPCLEALASLRENNIEIIVVDDASDDLTPHIAEKFRYTVIRLDRQSGPAVARNRGARAARGDIILFIDSDVIISQKAVDHILEDFSSDSELAAVVGMLDKETPYKNISSQFYNLRKHYDYSLIDGNLSTLYTTASAVRKDIFHLVGGFNENYTTPSVEDTDLGKRLYKLGYKIKLDKNVRVVHLKHFGLESLLKSDYMRTNHHIKLLMRERLANDIVKEKRFASFRIGSLFNAIISPIIVLACILSFFTPWALAALFLSVCIFILSNLNFLKFVGGVVGWKKNIFMPLVILMDSLAAIAGISAGIVSYLRGNRF